jgi:hypothetical protein
MYVALIYKSEDGSLLRTLPEIIEAQATEGVNPRLLEVNLEKGWRIPLSVSDAEMIPGWDYFNP